MCRNFKAKKPKTSCHISLIIFLAPLVIPYNPSSHESLDHVGEEKEVKYLNYAVFRDLKACLFFSFKILVI